MLRNHQAIKDNTIVTVRIAISAGVVLSAQTTDQEETTLRRIDLLVQ